MHNADIIGFKCLECIGLNDLENIIEVLAHRISFSAQLTHIGGWDVLVGVGLRQIEVLCLEGELHLV